MTDLPILTPAPLLLADIGATNARFSLSGGPAPDRTAVLPCAEFKSLDSALCAALEVLRAPLPPRRAALAVAGPVTGDTVVLTNLSWRFSVAGLRATLGLEQLEVVNDFTALALALPRLGPGDRRQIGAAADEAGAPDGGTGASFGSAGAPLAVLGPGSGLGVSGLIPLPGGGWLPLAGEGGHVTLAAADDRESAVLAWMRRRFGPVSAERAVSGPGLVTLYQAVCDLGGHAPAPLTAAAVTAAALTGACPHCLGALDLFAAFLGTVAGDLALTLGARGGVYLGGGIVPRLGDFLDRSAFRRRFLDKGPQRAYLAPIPTFVITHPLPAFLGLRTLLTPPEADRP
ncbi:MAG: glucokinase [Rhodospirillaceae bacterium]